VTQISLLDGRAMPVTAATERTADKFSRRLLVMAAKHCLAGSDLQAAQISVEFDDAVQLPTGRHYSFGEPFRCTVTLLDRRGRTYLASAVGRCARHDPAVERCNIPLAQPGKLCGDNE
jgi:hypothetical protein